MKFGIGQAVPRVEDARFLTGSGRYVDDMTFAHQAHGVIVFSAHANARIVRIDTATASAAPGVLCVLTGKDAIADNLGTYTATAMPEDFGAPKGYRTFMPLLCHDRVRFVGDRLAFVVAETAAQARDAAELIEIEYEPYPAVVTVEDAVRMDAPRVWEDCTGNVGIRLTFGNKAGTEAAFAAARHIVKLKISNNRLAPNPLEPRVAIGVYEAADEQYTLYASSQLPHWTRAQVSRILAVPENRIRVISPDVGGGFGLKSGIPDDALALWASRKIRRPVRWVMSRSDSLLADHHGREMVTRAELALAADGKILGLRAHTLWQIGAYIVGTAIWPAMFSQLFITGAYDVQHIDLALDGVFTNTSYTGPYRGAGRPESIYILERLVDLAAHEMGIDAAEIRRRNLIPQTRLPYATPTRWTFDSGDFPAILEKCLTQGDWNGFAERKAASNERGKYRGRAVSFFIEQGGVLNERMDLRFDPSGALTIVAGTHSHGQGHATVYAQLVHEWLGVPFENIRVIQGDTGQVAFGRGTYGARSSMLGGNALKMASDIVVEKGKIMAAALMEAAVGDIEFSDGQYRVVGTDKIMRLPDVAKAFYRPVRQLARQEMGLEATGTFDSNPPNHPNGAHLCEVEVDAETGGIHIDRYVVVDDLGRALNPLIVEGQVHGGVAQGIGQALVEHLIYDRRTGQLVTGSFMDYAMPRADLIPNIESYIEEIPSKTNPLGVKGIAESGTIGAPPTVINAILDALQPLGVTDIDMPASAYRVWEAMQRTRAKARTGSLGTL